MPKRRIEREVRRFQKRKPIFAIWMFWQKNILASSTKSQGEPEFAGHSNKDTLLERGDPNDSRIYLGAAGKGEWFVLLAPICRAWWTIGGSESFDGGIADWHWSGGEAETRGTALH